MPGTVKNKKSGNWGILILSLVAICCAFAYAGVKTDVISVFMDMGMIPSPVTPTPEPVATLVPTLAPAPALSSTPTPMPKPIELVAYEGTVYHLFTHCLIAFPELNAQHKFPLNNDCISTLEFKRILAELYANDFVLISLDDIYTVEGKKATLNTLKLPPGKKPLVFSFDDMVYDRKKLNWGMVHKVLLTDDGDFETYAKLPDGSEIYSKDNDIIPILESFIAKHPDFSPFGARGTLALTGWEGILGYRVARTEPNRASEIEVLRPLIAALKNRGWKFASHSYGHRNMRTATDAASIDDTKKWMNEIGTLVGPTNDYIYAFGAVLPIGSERKTFAVNQGFRIFCGVDTRPKLRVDADGTIYMGRQSLDGASFKLYKKQLSVYFDVDKVIDTELREKKEEMKANEKGYERN